MKEKYYKLIQAIKKIPLVRDGKATHEALASFHGDIKMFQKLVRMCESVEKKEEVDLIFEKWELYMNLRNKEDFIPLSESNNKSVYQDIFQCNI
ncbi:MAG: hypothetical protein KF862_07475 [Chitinophagaceae bacterium]|nr:hypothetical protein [Chitinophagaceae bacterium]